MVHVQSMLGRRLESSGKHLEAFCVRKKYESGASPPSVIIKVFAFVARTEDSVFKEGSVQLILLIWTTLEQQAILHNCCTL